MITGDHPRTAGVIARELGIAADARAITGVEFEKLTSDAATRTVADVSGVTEVKVDVVWDPPWDRGRMSEVAKLQLGMF